MMLETLPALALFAFVTSVTPGPNNLMLMASGANFGFRRTVPHMLGVSLGFVLMAFLVGAGLAGLFQTYPVAVTALEVVRAPWSSTATAVRVCAPTGAVAQV